MLHIVCALKPEARPLLDHFGLRALPDEPRIYHNADAHISLTLSGIGKSAAAGAVARTHAYFDADRSMPGSTWALPAMPTCRSARRSS